jgi:hypothetical protein
MIATVSVRRNHVICDLTSHTDVCNSHAVSKIKHPTRRLHLVDIENLMGCARMTESQAVSCCHKYMRQAGVRRDDLVVIACNHGAALAVGFGWRDARLLLRSGQHGADRALLDVIANENIDHRFRSVVIASGDGCFADSAASLAQAGVDVTVVSNARALSRRLKLAAKRVVFFDADPLPASSTVIPLRNAA